MGILLRLLAFTLLLIAAPAHADILPSPPLHPPPWPLPRPKPEIGYAEVYYGIAVVFVAAGAAMVVLERRRRFA